MVCTYLSGRTWAFGVRFTFCASKQNSFSINTCVERINEGFNWKNSHQKSDDLPLPQAGEGWGEGFHPLIPLSS